MPWYRIVIKKKDIRKPLTGIRHFQETNYQKIKKEVWAKASETIGEGAIDDIILEKLPPDHPEVVKIILSGKE
jgi:hypothetical protein